MLLVLPLACESPRATVSAADCALMLAGPGMSDSLGAEAAACSDGVVRQHKVDRFGRERHHTSSYSARHDLLDLWRAQGWTGRAVQDMVRGPTGVLRHPADPSSTWAQACLRRDGASPFPCCMTCTRCHQACCRRLCNKHCCLCANVHNLHAFSILSMLSTSQHASGQDPCTHLGIRKGCAQAVGPCRQ